MGRSPEAEMSYTLFEHRHRFASWAAARAAQRKLTSVPRLVDALESCGVVEVVGGDQSTWPLDAASFDSAHAGWCRRAVQRLHDKGVAAARYGHAAKLIAIYLKAMVVNGGYEDSAFARIAHPPVDSILLKNLAADGRFTGASRSLWRNTRWTQLDEAAYLKLITSFREAGLDQPAFWRIEEHWNPTG